MRFIRAILIAILVAPSDASAQHEMPKASDPRLVVELFAASPDIVHPIACDFDHKGRLLVIESHTHFPPQDYKGLKHDRIRIVEDTDGDGKADRFTTFFEGTRATMDIAVHPDGSVYLATRNEILRLRDTKGEGKADERTRILFLDTKGDYPHDGLSGLCFDSRGNLIFGMGENLGVAYKLIGADGTTISGQGDGGHIFRCDADGKKLRRIATGFWNPFGICRDIYGRVIAVDNDPDQAPPCRMVHVVDGGDYGFRFRYGRSGKHPFQSWHGQLAGTLPMMSGVGEGPCEVVSYESDGLPKEYRGQLLVTAWADHRVERYVVKNYGASLKADRQPFIQGGKDFRPVGLATAPDGSLFVSDWVLSNYNLHGKGAIWHIRWRDHKKLSRTDDPREAILNAHRALREPAAKKLASDTAGRTILREQLQHDDVRVRAAVLTALADIEDPLVDLMSIAMKDAELGMRELAVRAMVQRGADARRFLDARFPGSLRMESIRSLRDSKDVAQLLEFLTDADPFLRNAAVQQLAHQPSLLASIDTGKLREPRQRIGLLLAQRSAPQRDRTAALGSFLSDPDEEVRFLAVKWIADELLAEHRPFLVDALNNPALNVRMYLGYATALARLDKQEVSETKLADYFAKRLADDQAPAALRMQLLRQVPATHPKLTLALLSKLLAQNDESLQFEAIRAGIEHSNPKRETLLLNVLRNRSLAGKLRAHAALGLLDRAPEFADEFITLLGDADSSVRHEALRALTGVKLTPKQRAQMQTAVSGTTSSDSLERVLNRKISKVRPPAKDLDGWLKQLEGNADAEAGARVFFHPKLGGCFRCHRIDGRGKDVGPDLSTIGRTDRRHILESILQPSNAVAPHYQTWHLETVNGKTHTGMLIHTYLDEYTYLDSQGNQLKINTHDIADTRPVPISIMPDGLVELMTDQEIRDLLAYLESRK